MNHISGSMMRCVVLLFLTMSVFSSSVSATAPVLKTTPTPTPVVYVLPYPGILPTHPLYLLKTFRDRIIEFLISDPIRKAEFYILQADKQTGMGLMLVDKGKKPDAEAAWTEALALRTRSVDTLEGYVKTGGAIPGYLMEKMTVSAMKQQEVVGSLGSSTEAIDALLARIRQLSSARK